MKGNNFFQSNYVGLALAAQVVTAATANGPAIVEPWRKGRQITFLASVGDLTSTAQGHLKIQGRLRSDHTTWEDVKDVSGNDLEVVTTKLVASGAYDTNAVIGTIDFQDLDADTYDAIRLVAIEDTSAKDFPVGAVYVISDLYEKPATPLQTDEFFYKMRQIDTP